MHPTEALDLQLDWRRPATTSSSGGFEGWRFYKDPIARVATGREGDRPPPPVLPTFHMGPAASRGRQRRPATAARPDREDATTPTASPTTSATPTGTATTPDGTSTSADVQAGGALAGG